MKELEIAAQEELIHSYSSSTVIISTYGESARIEKCESFFFSQEAMINMFRKGAEWQAKQSPWIRVEDKDGCDTSDDCVVMTKNFEIFKAYFSSENKWMKSNGGYYDEVIDDVICWMPIPSFDEILEANKDVLERIKEKGD